MEMDISTQNGTADATRLEGKFKAALVCWFLGIGTFICWNSLLTIEDYYNKLFSDYHPARVLTLVFQPFSFGVMALLAFKEGKINTRNRIITGYTLFTATTLMLLLLDIVTSGKGGIGPFIGICIIVALFGVANAYVLGGITGDLSLMCPEILQSFLAGLAASGALTSGLRLITKAAFDKANNGLRKGVMLFLAISTFLELLCIILYAFYFTKLPIVKYYHTKAALEESEIVQADLAAVEINKPESEDSSKRLEQLSSKKLLLQNIDYAMDLFLIYVLTLSIFPGFLYENTGEHKLGSWYALVLVAVFNCWDLIGRYVPVVKLLKLESRKGLMVATLARFLLVPAFYFTAKYGDQGWMIMLISFLGLTNGYLTVCVITVAPKGYKGGEANCIGNLLATFQTAGVFAGIALDFLWIIGNDKF